MLVQTSNDAGLKSFIGKSPNDLTKNGAGRFKLDSYESIRWAFLNGYH